MKKTITITAGIRDRDETRLNRIFDHINSGEPITDKSIDDDILQLSKAIICQLETLQVSMKKEKPAKHGKKKV